VLGRVKEPGRVAIPATRDLTVSGAIQQAGGFAPSAKDSAILVTRSLPDGKTESRTINLKAVGTAGRLEDDIILQAEDVVFVPEAMF
jgi:protein involved in polysaccharide export with SLBB domain